MKVKELIELLHKLDKEKEIMYFDHDEGELSIDKIIDSEFEDAYLIK